VVYIHALYKLTRVRQTGLTVSRDVDSSPHTICFKRKFIMVVLDLEVVVQQVLSNQLKCTVVSLHVPIYNECNLVIHVVQMTLKKIRGC
jgi:hypothetical protein